MKAKILGAFEVELGDMKQETTARGHAPRRHGELLLVDKGPSNGCPRWPGEVQLLSARRWMSAAAGWELDSSPKIPRSRRWRISLPGRRVMAAAVKLREVAYPSLYADAA